MAKKRILKEKPRCNGTMTQSAFWSFIRSALRQKSRFWKPISKLKHQLNDHTKDQEDDRNLNISATYVRNGFLKSS